MIKRNRHQAALYVHIPWCVRKCPYCDFNSHEISGDVPESRYIDALLADLDFELEQAGELFLETIFIGGGTPSLFSPEAINRLLDGVSGRMECASDLEVTLEANPGTVESGRFSEFRSAGVNRLSIGVQSFQDHFLERLGRIHTGGEAERAIEIAIGSGFENFNLDLMFGLPGQYKMAAMSDVKTALRFSPAHLSYYQLTLEPNTLFYRQPPSLPNDELSWSIQAESHELLKENGYQQYEVSAWAQPKRRCRHNLNYWRFGDYIGVGAGAHGKLTDDKGVVQRRWKTKHPRRYLEFAGSRDAVGGEQSLSKEELPLEFMMNAFRLKEGFELSRFEQATGLSLEVIADKLERLEEEGLVIREDSSVRCSDKGWDFLDEMLQSFMDTE